MCSSMMVFMHQGLGIFLQTRKPRLDGVWTTWKITGIFSLKLKLSFLK